MVGQLGRLGRLGRLGHKMETKMDVQCEYCGEGYRADDPWAAHPTLWMHQSCVSEFEKFGFWFAQPVCCCCGTRENRPDDPWEAYSSDSLGPDWMHRSCLKNFDSGALSQGQN